MIEVKIYMFSKLTLLEQKRVILLRMKLLDLKLEIKNEKQELQKLFHELKKNLKRILLKIQEKKGIEMKNFLEVFSVQVEGLVLSFQKMEVLIFMYLKKTLVVLKMEILFYIEFQDQLKEIKNLKVRL
jgi:hypothetical protein